MATGFHYANDLWISLVISTVLLQIYLIASSYQQTLTLKNDTGLFTMAATFEDELVCHINSHFNQLEYGISQWNINCSGIIFEYEAVFDSFLILTKHNVRPNTLWQIIHKLLFDRMLFVSPNVIEVFIYLEHQVLLVFHCAESLHDVLILLKIINILVRSKVWDYWDNVSV